MNSTVQVRIDTKTKNEAQAVLERLGLDISSGVKVFLRQVIETRSLPFSVRTGNGLTKEYEETLLRERASLRKKGANSKVHKTTKSLFKEIGL